MQREKKHDDSFEELLRVSRELSALIEDNNQNIRDCYRTLKQIEQVVCPPKGNLFVRAIRKLLNKCMRL
jgi:hypothetical protein